MIEVRRRDVDDMVRRGEVLEIRGEDGAPPYLMQITEVARQTKDDAGNASSLSRRQSRGMAEENLRRERLCGLLEVVRQVDHDVVERVADCQLRGVPSRSCTSIRRRAQDGSRGPRPHPSTPAESCTTRCAPRRLAMRCGRVDAPSMQTHVCDSGFFSTASAR
jgi:hypothetical protein